MLLGIVFQAIKHRLVGWWVLLSFSSRNDVGWLHHDHIPLWLLSVLALLDPLGHVVDLLAFERMEFVNDDRLPTLYALCGVLLSLGQMRQALRYDRG